LYILKSWTRLSIHVLKVLVVYINKLHNVEDDFLSVLKLLLNLSRKLEFAVTFANKYYKTTVKFNTGISNICHVYCNKYFNQFLKFISHTYVKYHTKSFISVIQISCHTLVESAEIIVGFINNK
jgi:hypothetical protein